MLDVASEIQIARPRAEVAVYVVDPDNAPRWCKTITAVEWETSPPVAVGARFTLVAKVLASPLSYTYEVRELVEGERFVVTTADGPFQMETTYTWADAPAGGTLMTLRNQGEPKNKLTVPILERAIGRANRKDLRRLKKLLERRG